jgi:hypothetical protein
MLDDHTTINHLLTNSQLILRYLAILPVDSMDFVGNELASTFPAAAVKTDTTTGDEYTGTRRSKTWEIPESRYFCWKIFSGILLEKIGKNYATAHAFGGPDSSASPRFDPARGSKLWLSHDLTPFRDALQVFSALLRKPARRYGYRGLKIFTSLALRFQDFQRMTRLNASIVAPALRLSK